MDSEYICGVTVEDMNAWLVTGYPDDDLAADEDLRRRIAMACPHLEVHWEG